jgi:hypothetical protein
MVILFQNTQGGGIEINSQNKSFGKTGTGILFQRFWIHSAPAAARVFTVTKM